MIRWYLRQGLKYAMAALPTPAREPWSVRHRLVRSREHLTPSQVRELQVASLNRILGWTARYVPFYRGRGLTATLPLNSVEDLRHWPIVDRDTIAHAPTLFRADRFPRLRTRSGTTTGRSGHPLTILWEWPHAIWWEWAFHERLFRWAGLRRGFRRVVLRGGLVHGPRGPESRWWQVVPHRRELILSVYQLSEATVADYVRAMNRFRPHALQAYPSAAVRLARLASDAGLTLPRVQAVVTSSETLEPEDRRFIEDIIHAPVFDFYGHAERAAAAAQCELRSGYHVFEDYGYLEILDVNGNPVPDGAVGELVATGFHNRAMPFIRYRTGDYGAFAPEGCRCGRAFRLLKVLQGRPADSLLAHDGSRVSLRLGLGSADLEGIVELRFYQSRPGEAEVRYVGRSDPLIQERLLAALQTRVGHSIQFHILRVDRLPPGPGGKAVLVVHEALAS